MWRNSMYVYMRTCLEVFPHTTLAYLVSNICTNFSNIQLTFAVTFAFVFACYACPDNTDSDLPEISRLVIACIPTFCCYDMPMY